MPKVNDITKDQWKAMRTAAEIEKTSWWKGSGPSVGSKLETWQTKREAAKAFRKLVEKADYKFVDGHDHIVCNAKIALHELVKALKQMLDKVTAQKPRTTKLDKFQTEVKALYDEALAKVPKWENACLKAKAKNREDMLKTIKDCGI